MAWRSVAWVCCLFLLVLVCGCWCWCWLTGRLGGLYVTFAGVSGLLLRRDAYPPFPKYLGKRPTGCVVRTSSQFCCESVSQQRRLRGFFFSAQARYCAPSLLCCQKPYHMHMSIQNCCLDSPAAQQYFRSRPTARNHHTRCPSTLMSVSGGFISCSLKPTTTGAVPLSCSRGCPLVLGFPVICGDETRFFVCLFVLS